tara:strand:- start:870 stop:1013 length:144 start_codon:yes stop_codon:yes gene_type:complete
MKRDDFKDITVTLCKDIDSDSIMDLLYKIIKEKKKTYPDSNGFKSSS